MSRKRVYRYSKKAIRRHIAKQRLYLLAPFLLLIMLSLIWANFYFGFNSINTFYLLCLIGVGATVAGAVGLALKAKVLESLRFEIDETGFSINGRGQPQLTIPFREISEIVESKWGAVQIKSESLNRKIQLLSTGFDADDYRIIKGELENWQVYSPLSNKEYVKAVLAIGGLVIFGILCPIFISSSNPIIKTLPFSATTILMVILLVWTRNKREGPNQNLTRYMMYFLAAISALQAIMLYR